MSPDFTWEKTRALIHFKEKLSMQSNELRTLKNWQNQTEHQCKCCKKA